MRLPRRRALLSVLTAALFSILATETFAARTVQIPVYPIRQVYRYDPTCPVGSKIGAILSHSLKLTNLSTLPQTVTVTVMPSSNVSARVAGCAIPWPTIQAVHCIGPSKVAAPLNALPPVTATIAPNDSQEYLIGISASTNFATGCTGGHDAGDVQFAPSLQITVTENRGALIASMVPHIDGPVNGYSFCAALPLTGYGCNVTSLPETRTTVPLLINGGRPF